MERTMKTITHALLGFVAGTTLLAMIAMTTSCAGTPLHGASKKQAPKKPIHVPLVAYTAHISDKDCKPIPGTPMFRCNNVVLDPQTIDARQASGR
jgi:hypothetical protein